MGASVNWSRGVLLATCLGGALYALHVSSVSPPLVPMHFGPSGAPDRFGSPRELLAVHLGLLVGGTALFAALPALFRRASPGSINLPNKDYWLSPAHRAEATERFTRWSHVLGAAVNLLVVTLQLVLGPGRPAAAPAPASLHLVMLGFLVFTFAWCVWLVRSFRLPKANS